MFVLSVEAEPPDDLFLEIASLINDALEPFHGVVSVDPTRRSYHTFSKAEELATNQIDLDRASHEESGAIGAVPPP